MKTLLLIALAAAFIGAITSTVVFFRLLFAKKTY